MSLLINCISRSTKWTGAIDNIGGKIEEICQSIVPLTPIKPLLEDKSITAELNVFLVSNNQIQKFNNEFRKKNTPTNILSFPMFDFSKINDGLHGSLDIFAVLGDFKELILGDIVIAFETVNIESIRQNKTFFNHLTHLIIHSILHLLGYDHEKDKQAEFMENMEIEILKKLGISNPYRN